jgi:type VII secretion integral membrane protein EccD
VPAPSSGLARVTIRAPRRRLDLAIPHQVPLAELLPEVLRRAGEAGPEADPRVAGAPAGGWVLRRGDGGSLQGDTALAQQGVRDGDVLYLVPRHLTWPEPEYDDVIEEIAANARRHGRTWDAATTRVFALVAAGLVLCTGLGVLVAVGPPRVVPALAATTVAVVLLVCGALVSRALGDGVAGAAAAGLGLPYAAVAGVLLTGGGEPTLRVGPNQVLVGGCALLLASVVGAVAIGHGLRVFSAGVSAALFAILFAGLGFALPPAGAAAIVIVTLVAGIGLAPLLSVRLGKLPLPVVTASPEIIAGESRPPRPAVLAAVVRADELLAGILLGIAVSAVGLVAGLSVTTGPAGPLLAGLASAALLLRARLFPSVAARLPLLVSGLVGLALTGAAWAATAGSAARLIGVAGAFVAVVALLATAAGAPRRRVGTSPYLGRVADILDVTAVVALAPVACAVLNLYTWIRDLSS